MSEDELSKASKRWKLARENPLKFKTSLAFPYHKIFPAEKYKPNNSIVFRKAGPAFLFYVL